MLSACPLIGVSVIFLFFPLKAVGLPGSNFNIESRAPGSAIRNKPER